VSPPGFEPTLEATIEFSARAPAEARRAVEALASDVDPGLLGDMQLLVSEVVTNSVRHSGSDEPIRLRVWTRPSGVKVEVADGGFGFGFDVDEFIPGDAEGGRGLVILDALADRWGVNPDTCGRVWFELAPRAVSRSAQAT